LDNEESDHASLSSSDVVEEDAIIEVDVAINEEAASRRTMNLSIYYPKQIKKKHIVHCALWEKLCLDVKCIR
jgi:hypothetical protein